MRKSGYKSGTGRVGIIPSRPHFSLNVRKLFERNVRSSELFQNWIFLLDVNRLIQIKLNNNSTVQSSTGHNSTSEAYVR